MVGLHNFLDLFHVANTLMSLVVDLGHSVLDIILGNANVPEPHYDIPFLKQDWLDAKKLLKLVVRFSINLFFIFVIIRLIYYPAEKRKDFLFTYFAIGITVFTLCFTLDSIKIDLAFALGLFAIFGIIRYRTDAIPIKEMTYLFLIIGLSVMNALINKKISIVEMLFANSVFVFTTFGIERLWLLRHEVSKKVLYDRIDLLQRGRRHELIADLKERTGIEISRVDIGRIDLLRDTVQIIVYYYLDEQEPFDKTN